MKQTLAVVILLLAVFSLSAQYSPCYYEKLDQGKALYNQQQYKEARQIFINAKRCPDPNVVEANAWIKKCDEGYQNLACYEEKCTEGEILYDKGDYEGAKKKFEAAKSSCNYSDTKRADEWIRKCEKSQQSFLCYKEKCAEGEELYKQGEYRKAKQLFIEAKKNCHYSDTKLAEEWIMLCDTMYASFGFDLKYSVRGVTFYMIPVLGGTFTMGCTPEQGNDCKSNESPAHKVTLSNFYIGELEVSQALWKKVMANNPSDFKGNDALPVENVSWNDCQSFIKVLNEILADTLPKGWYFALPTEAQWEYAARGGKKSRHYKYSGSDSIDSVAWYSGKTRLIRTEISAKNCNEVGLFNMSGNVWEWCADRYGRYGRVVLTDPQGPSSGSFRVLRGGSFGSVASNCRVSSRDFDYPDNRLYNYGFRLVLVHLEDVASFADSINTFVNQIEKSGSKFVDVDWSIVFEKYDMMMMEYERIYKKLSIKDLDRVDNAIERYRTAIRKYGVAQSDDLLKIVVDDIEYDTQAPTTAQLHQWRDKYANICSAKVKEMNCRDYKIPSNMKKDNPCLVYLIMNAKSLSEKKKKQEFFDRYKKMSGQQIDKLYDILYRENYKLGSIEMKYNLIANAKKYAQSGDFYKAFQTIDNAIALDPNHAYLYNLKGEFCIMQNRWDKALEMWHKVNELDPKFLDEYDGHTNLYDGLVKKGMLTP